jgi:hypothetical protein
MASDRIGNKAAELVAVPPYEIIFTTTDRLLAEPTVAQNIHNVPANEPLIASIKENGIKNPFLAMKSWYPIAGSQRLRAVQILKETDPDFDLDVTVHRFLDDWHNCYYLWPDEKFRADAIAIWFQMQEAVFKTRFYEHDTDSDETKMTEYEDLGDKLKWKHNGDSDGDNLRNDNNGSNSKNT